MTTKLKVGIVGLGFIGTAKHLAGLAQHMDKCEIVGFCDLEIEKAQAAQQQHGSPDSYATADYRDLLEDPSIDVIHVCTWNVTHCEITCAALEAGKHVLCEKPMAVTGAEARQMLETAERTGKKLSVAYQYRFRKDSQFLHRVVEEGHLGEIYAAKAHAVRRRAVPTWGVFTDKDKQGGGPLVDVGGHALDLALWHMGNYDVESVTGVVNRKLVDKPEGNRGGPWDPATYTVEDSAFGFVRFTNGASLFLEAAWALNVQATREACVTLCGTDGGADTAMPPLDGTFRDPEVTLNGVQGGELVTTKPELGPSFPPGSGGPFVYMGALEADTWLTAVADDTEPYVKAEEACVVTEILDAIYVSAETGEPVYFNRAGAGVAGGSESPA